MSLEYVIYTDESDKAGKFFSNFYGGVLVRSPDVEAVIERIKAAKTAQNLFQEVKWQKVTPNYLDKYIALMDAFFSEVEADRAKVRVMFTNNQYVPQSVTPEQRRIEYHLLYYQFLKHSFGLQYSAPERAGNVRIRLNLDQMPTSREQAAQFKSYLLGLNHNRQMREAQVAFSLEQMAEVDSRQHVLLQCLDVVLGAMVFRLNNKHKEKPEGQRRRGKRTVAKEKLYRHICRRVRDIYPGFNVGESTGIQGQAANRWRHPYRHWKFVPKNHQRDRSKAKP